MTQPVSRLLITFALLVAQIGAQIAFPYPPPSPGNTTPCDILIAGGTFGGVAAAVGASGLDTWVIEDSDWIGGQVTSQGVSPLDEHRFIETFGGTFAYDTFRKRIRDHYGEKNPGRGWVSRLCFEPRIGLKVLEQLARESRTKVLLNARVTAITRQAEKITSATVTLKDGSTRVFKPKFILDATDLGDIYPLAGIPFRIGSDAKADTGEPHADTVANPRRTQSFTYCFAVDFVKGNKELINKPRDTNATVTISPIL